MKFIATMMVWIGVLLLAGQVVAEDLAIKTTPEGIILQAKLKSLVIDKIDFNKADVAEVIKFLQAKSKELDPDHKGANFVLNLPDNSDPVMKHVHREVSITLDNISMYDLLDAICEETNLKCTIEGYAVELRPVAEPVTPPGAVMLPLRD